MDESDPSLAVDTAPSYEPAQRDLDGGGQTSALFAEAAQAAPQETGFLAIDLAAIVSNWKQLGRAALPAVPAAVVKADAYGCGLASVTTALTRAGCKTFFVATLEEAALARAQTADAAIYVLDGFFTGAGDRYPAIGARPVIGDLGELAEWQAFRAASGWRGGAALHVDTGMNRLGVSVADAAALAPMLEQGDQGIDLVMSHLACAETPDHPLNARQIADFTAIAQAFAPLPASLSNSSGIYLGPRAHFDLLRPGAALYGVNPTPDRDNPMQPVATLRVRVLKTREIERGATVGYGAVWTARRPTRLAIVAAGYADGYFRAAGGVDGVRSADVIVAGQRCPIAGRISMDLIAIDVSDLAMSAVKRGDLVTLLGDGLSVDEIGLRFGTIGYEVLTSLGRRYARLYHGMP